MRRDYYRRIDAGILAGMIVPPADFRVEPFAADMPLTREARAVGRNQAVRPVPEPSKGGYRDHQPHAGVR